SGRGSQAIGRDAAGRERPRPPHARSTHGDPLVLWRTPGRGVAGGGAGRGEETRREGSGHDPRTPGAPMKTRSFCGVPVSEVGLGCWQIGGDQWGDVPDNDATEVLRASAAAGVTF